MILTAEEYARVRSQAAVEYPAECCGVVMDKNGERLLIPCRNIQDELHAKDPQRHPRDSRTAYYIDPKDLIAMGRREAQGYRVLTIYHSHIDAGAYFSATDKHNALIHSVPAFPWSGRNPPGTRAREHALRCSLRQSPAGDSRRREQSRARLSRSGRLAVLRGSGGRLPHHRRGRPDLHRLPRLVGTAHSRARGILARGGG